MYKKLIGLVIITTTIVTVISFSVFATDIYDYQENDSIKILRNNPFTYSYEQDLLKLTATQYFTQAEANNSSKWIDIIAIGISATQYGIPIGALMAISARLDGMHNQPGTLKIWSGEKREIATSSLTGKSHISNTWVTYRILYTGDDGIGFS